MALTYSWGWIFGYRWSRFYCISVIGQCLKCLKITCAALLYGHGKRPNTYQRLNSSSYKSHHLGYEIKEHLCILSPTDFFSYSGFEIAPQSVELWGWWTGLWWINMCSLSQNVLCMEGSLMFYIPVRTAQGLSFSKFQIFFTTIYLQ